MCIRDSNKSLSNETDNAHAANPISPLLAKSEGIYFPLGRPKKSQNKALVLVILLPFFLLFK